MPVITISRTLGSGGAAIGKALANRLKYRYFNRDELARIARTHRYMRADLDGVDETSLVLFDRLFRDKPREVLTFIHDAVCDAAEEGDVVILGRGGQAILRDLPTAFHVRVDAPLEVRIPRMVERLGGSEAKARKRIKEVDGERERFVHQAFGLDPSNPMEYHLVINTGKMDESTSTKVVLQAFRQFHWQDKEGQARAMLRRFRLVKEIRGELIRHEHISCPSCVGVQCDAQGVVTLSGRLTDPWEKPMIENVARRVRGVKQVINKLRP